MKFTPGEYESRDGTIFVIDLIREGAEYPLVGYRKDDPTKFSQSWMKDGRCYKYLDESKEDLMTPAPKKKRVPLEVSDIPPGSVLRHESWSKEKPWAAISTFADAGASIIGQFGRLSLINAAQFPWQILRPGGEWLPMWKEIEK